MQAPSTIALNNGAITPVSKVFALYYPASGDGGIAEYALEEGTTRDQYPRLTLSARKRTDGRASLAKISCPQVTVNPVSGTVSVVKDAVLIKIEVVAKGSVPQSLCDDAKAYAANLLAATSVKELFTKQLPLT